MSASLQQTNNNPQEQQLLQFTLTEITPFFRISVHLKFALPNKISNFAITITDCLVVSTLLKEDLM